MNVLKKLRLRLRTKTKSEYKYYKKIEKYRARLQTVEPVQLDFPVGRTVNFKHSGNCGDIIYAIPTMLAIAGNQKIRLYLHIDQPAEYAKYIRHPMGRVMLNRKAFQMIRPLLLAQPEFESCEAYANQPIDVDLDKMRQYPLLLDRGNIARWYFLVFPVNYDLNLSWLRVQPDTTLNKGIVIARSSRYRAPAISYEFLGKYPDIWFVGLEDEYEDMKKMLPQIKYRPINDFNEMAAAIAGAGLFIGNQSFPFSIAEALKVNRLLELHWDCPNVTVYGDRGADFCFQPQFEKLVAQRYEALQT